MLVLLQDDYYILVMNFPAFALGGVVAGSLVFLMQAWQQSLHSSSPADFHYDERLVNKTYIQHFPFFSHQWHL